MTTEKQLWVGYYQLTYLNQPNTLYFGHLIGFAENRDIFQQRIEDYKTHYQCKLSSQLAPLPATTWFQRHGYQATVWSAAQQLKEQELRFLLVQQETQQGTQSYLSQESLTISPLQSIFETHSYQPPYLPEALVNHPFFAQLNSQENPKEGLVYPNPDFIPNPDSYRYYTVVDGVKSFILPQLCEREGQTDSLYKGDLKTQMHLISPSLPSMMKASVGLPKFYLHKPNRNGSVVGISIRPSLFVLSIPLRKYIIICVNLSISIKKRRRNGTFSDSTTHRYWWLICIILNMTQRA